MRPTIRPLTDDLNPEAIRLLSDFRTRWAGTVVREGPSAAGALEDIAGRPVQGSAALEDGRLVGIALVADDGAVLDWVVTGEGVEETARALLSAVESWARERGLPTIDLAKAPGDPPFESALLRMGFRPVPAPVATLRVLDLPSLLQSIVAARAEQAVPGSPFTLHVRLTAERGAGSVERDLWITVRDDVVSVGPRSSAAADARFETTLSALTAFVFGASEPARFFGSASVEPGDARERIEALVSMLRIDRPWFSPLGDHPGSVR